MKLKVPVGLSINFSPLSGGTLVNSFTNKYLDINILENELLIGILSKCGSWIDYHMVIHYLTNSFKLTNENADMVIKELLNHTILVSDNNQRYMKIDNNQQVWNDFNWGDPLKFHIHTNNLKKTDYWNDPTGLDDIRRMKEKVKESPPPSNFKELTDKPILKLSKKQKIISELNLDELFFDDVGEDKQNLNINLDQLSAYIYYSFGQTATKTDPVTGLHISKTSPSGGARHPAEVYLFVKNIDGLAQGIYHYNVKEHGLTELEIGDQDQFIQEHIICHKNRPGFDYKVAFVHTLIFERSMHRYREPRSYRAVTHDLGHLMQTAALIASYSGWNSYRGYSMHDEIVDEKLKIDGILESSCTFTLIG